MSSSLRHVEVYRVGDELEVTWEGGEVAVHVGESPDEPGRCVDEQASGGRVLVGGLEPGRRYYVHLVGAHDEVTVAAERLVALRGALNFRDLGGYRSTTGATVRWGRIYRSDHLGGLHDDDLALLERLGVQVVVDFRGAHEHLETPSRIDGDGAIRRLDRPIGDGTADGRSFYDQVVDGSLAEFTPRDLAEFYLRTLEQSAGTFAEVLTLLADPAQHAAVFHCTAGKDRTGLAAALLLGALGVDDDTIVADYGLTNRYRSGRRLEVLRPQLAERGIDVDRYLPLFVAPPESMADALAGLRSRHGGIVPYLTGVAGLDPDIVTALRSHLLR